MTMIEHPKIGEGVETEIRENMVFSMHPHVIAENGVDCLYMQDTWLVTADGGRAARGTADADLPRRRVALLELGQLLVVPACLGHLLLGAAEEGLHGDEIQGGQ